MQTITHLVVGTMLIGMTGFIGFLLLIWASIIEPAPQPIFASADIVTK